MCGALIYVTPYTQPMLYLVFFGGCYSTFQRFYHGDTHHPGFYRMTAGQRTAVLVTYGGLVCPARFHGTQGPGPMDHIAQVRISGVYLGSGHYGNLTASKSDRNSDNTVLKAH